VGIVPVTQVTDLTDSLQLILCFHVVSFQCTMQ